jgi:hypothetical protein
MNLRTLALVSAVYDLLLAAGMLFAAPFVAQLMGAAPPVPLLNAQLNGLFTLSLGVGYFWALRDDATLRGYLWIFNVLAKGLGAIIILIDQFTQGSPRTFLALVATDGTLALLTFLALRAARSEFGRRS